MVVQLKKRFTLVDLLTCSISLPRSHHLSFIFDNKILCRVYNRTHIHSCLTLLTQQQLGYDNIPTGFHEGSIVLVSALGEHLRRSIPNLLHFINIDHCWQPPKLLLEFTAVHQGRHSITNINSNNKRLSVYGYYSLYSLCDDRRRSTTHQIITIRRRQPCRILIKASAVTACWLQRLRRA